MLLISILVLTVSGLAAFLSLLRRQVVAFVTADANQVYPSVLGISSPDTISIRLLTFGDDWTEGITWGGQAFHPYASALGDYLHPQLPLGVHLEIQEQGKSGDTVLGGMKDRLQRTLDEHAGKPYNWVLLQGGINDLLSDASQASEVLAGLDVLVQSCLAHGASVVLMTLLEVSSPEPAVEAQRTALNASLREYVEGRKWQKAPELAADGAPVAEIRLRGAAPAKASAAADLELMTTPSAGSKAPGVVLCDLASYLPTSALSDQERWELWHNETQLTVDGHDAVGLLLSNTLASQLNRRFVL